MDYTSEQVIIIKENAPLTVVKALAGTGKTSTLLGYARLRKNVRMLYIVLNKSVQKEAEVKFRGTGVKTCDLSCTGLQVYRSPIPAEAGQ